MQNNAQYLVRVTAMDGAGVAGFAESSPVKIVGDNHNLTPAQVTLVVALTVAGSCIVAAGITFFLIRSRCVCLAVTPCLCVCVRACVRVSSCNHSAHVRMALGGHDPKSKL